MAKDTVSAPLQTPGEATPADNLAADQKEAARNAAANAAHNQRMSRDIGQYTITGIRLSRKDAMDEGMVLTLSADEAAPVVALLGEVLKRRQ